MNSNTTQMQAPSGQNNTTVFCSSVNLFSVYNEKTSLLFSALLVEIYNGFVHSDSFRQLSFEEAILLHCKYGLLKTFIENIRLVNDGSLTLLSNH